MVEPSNGCLLIISQYKLQSQVKFFAHATRRTGPLQMIIDDCFLLGPPNRHTVNCNEKTSSWTEVLYITPKYESTAAQMSDIFDLRRLGKLNPYGSVPEIYLSTSFESAKFRVHGLYRWRDNTKIENLKSGLVETARYDIEPTIDRQDLWREADNVFSDCLATIKSSFKGSGVRTGLKCNIPNFANTRLALVSCVTVIHDGEWVIFQRMKYLSTP